MNIVTISTFATESMTSLVATLKNHQKIVASNVNDRNLVNVGIAGSLISFIKSFVITLMLWHLHRLLFH
jgi:Ca2+/Na+ antiporter